MKKESLKQQAYNIIKDKIINCEYAPNDLLNEEKLKEEIGASRTPVRDALSRLEQERLVHILPKKGIMVASLSIRDINAIYEARMLIEPYAIEHYGDKISKEKFAEYKKSFQKIKETVKSGSEKPGNLYEIDDQFHIEFINVMENEYFISMYEQIYNQNRRLRILSGVRGKNRMTETQDEHHKIVECCICENWRQAANEMREHLAFSKKAAFDAIFQNGDIFL